MPAENPSLESQINLSQKLWAIVAPLFEDAVEKSVSGTFQSVSASSFLFLCLVLCPVAATAGTCVPDRSAVVTSAPYATYTSSGDLVFISGQIGIEPGSDGAAPAFDAQLSTALARLEAALEIAGSSVHEVLKTTVYLSDLANMARMNELYRAFFESRGAPLPARSLVPGLDFGGAIAVEIDVVARSLPCDAAVRSSYVSVPVSAPAGRDGKTWSVAGNLRYPESASESAPAVLILHGSAGIDSRGELHARALNAAGFITLELDLWAARGWMADRSGRPAGVPETLPDAFAALRFLSEMPEVDGTRIGVMGFSWGGVMAMLAASEQNIEKYGSGRRFAAHAPFYPVCWAYDRVPGYELGDLTQAPVLIQTGALDDYDEASTCLELNQRYERAFEVIVYPDAHHGFNSLGVDMQVEDPFSHLGRGGVVRFKSNPVARAAAVLRVTEFFQRTLAAGPGSQ